MRCDLPKTRSAMLMNFNLMLLSTQMEETKVSDPLAVVIYDINHPYPDNLLPACNPLDPVSTIHVGNPLLWFLPAIPAAFRESEEWSPHD